MQSSVITLHWKQISYNTHNLKVNRTELTFFLKGLGLKDRWAEKIFVPETSLCLEDRWFRKIAGSGRSLVQKDRRV